MTKRLTSAQTDRACGVLLGAACGDALGAGYEFGSAPLPAAGTTPEMIGGGLGDFEPGEWTDDTAQAYAIAEVAATGADLRSEEALTAIARRFADWYADGPPDVGIQTRAVLSRAGRSPSGGEMTDVARDVHLRTGKSAGNGSLMRTGAVALAYLHDPVALVETAMRVSGLTHHDSQAGEACALWCLFIRQAVLTGSLDDLRGNLVHLPESSRAFWADRLDEAETRAPGTFTPNGWTVSALQAAWSAIAHTPVPDERPADGSFACLHLQHSLETAIRVGDDTDTVAAIAGALLGARWGVSAIPARWRMIVHGWPGARAADLVDHALLAVGGGRPDRQGWPGCDRLDYSGYHGFESYALHPHDRGVHLSGVARLEDASADVDAVVSLCRLGAGQVPDGLRVGQVDFRILDTVAEDNPNLAFALDDAARTVARMRDEGKTVLLHCVAARSRTPSVAIRYSMLRGVPFEEAYNDVRRALPGSAPRRHFVDALRSFSPNRAMRITVVRGDIVDQPVDAVVTAGNTSLRGGSGVNGAVHAAAGPQLLAASRALAPCPPGSAVVTPAFDLRPARWVIHAVGPKYRSPADEATLESAYQSALARADEVGARSVAFPSISTGVYGYPEQEAAEVAVRALSRARTNVESVVLVAFSDRMAALWRAALERTGEAGPS